MNGMREIELALKEIDLNIKHVKTQWQIKEAEYQKELEVLNKAEVLINNIKRSLEADQK